MGFYDKTNYFKMAETLDFAANDQYPTGYYFKAPGQPPYEVAACMDFIRCVKQKNFWMMEMQSGPTGGSVIGAIRVQDRIFCGQLKVSPTVQMKLHISDGEPACLEQNSSGMGFYHIMVCLDVDIRKFRKRFRY